MPYYVILVYPYVFLFAYLFIYLFIDRLIDWEIIDFCLFFDQLIYFNILLPFYFFFFLYRKLFENKKNTYVQQPSNFKSAFDDANINTDHKVRKTAFFADLMHESFSTIQLPTSISIFCWNKILNISVNY